MNALRTSLLCAALSLCAAPAFADFAIQYFVGYGLYYPFAPDTTSTVSRTTGLLATNGTHRALIQLIWAGPNGQISPPDLNNPVGGYVSSDDGVLDSRILEAGIDGVDEWGHTASLPQPFIITNALHTPVYVRVHMDDSPQFAGHWWRDSPLVYPTNQCAGGPEGIFATVVHIETGSETPPTAGVALDQWVGPLDTPRDWYPDSPSDPMIQNLVFDPASDGVSFPIPFGCELSAMYGADSTLPGGGWDWKTLSEGVDYSADALSVTLATSGAGLPPFRIIRLGLTRLYY